MNFVDKILSNLGYVRPSGYSNGSSLPNLNQMDFMAWSGRNCDDGFCIDLKCLDGVSRAYKECSTVSTVIGKLSTAMANGKFWIVDEKDNDVSYRYENIYRLLTNPNPLQTQSEFEIQKDTIRLLYGEVFIYFSVPVGLGINDAVSMWILNPNCVEINTTGKMFDQSSKNGIIKNYTITLHGERRTVDPENILHIKDSYQNLDFSPRELRGTSRLQSLEYEIRNIVQAQKAIYSLNRDRGAMGIIYPKEKDVTGSIPLTPKEEEQIHRKSMTDYGMLPGQRKFIFAPKEVGYERISFNVQELMLIEGIKSNIEQITDVFNVPFDLLANAKGSTFNNKSEAEKIMYQDAVIPFSKIYSEKYNRIFGLTKDRIIIDFSEVECLKEAEKEKAEAKLRNAQATHIAYLDGIVTRNEYRQGLEMDKIPEGDRYYEQKEN